MGPVTYAIQMVSGLNNIRLSQGCMLENGSHCGTSGQNMRSKGWGRNKLPIARGPFFSQRPPRIDNLQIHNEHLCTHYAAKKFNWFYLFWNIYSTHTHFNIFKFIGSVYDHPRLGGTCYIFVLVRKVLTWLLFQTWLDKCRPSMFQLIKPFKDRFRKKLKSWPLLKTPINTSACVLGYASIKRCRMGVNGLE